MKRLRKILLVEDSPQDVELTLAALQEHNLINEVIVTRDGVQALDYLHARGNFAGREKGLPAAVLLDLKMPKMDGLQVLRHMKADDELKLIPVVMLTSSREEQDLVASYRIGVNAYVVKPIGFEEFVSAIKQVGLFWAVLNEVPPASNQ